MAESRSRDGSTPCRRVFHAVGSVPGLTKETYRPEGAKFPSSYAQEKTKEAKTSTHSKLARTIAEVINFYTWCNAHACTNCT